VEALVTGPGHTDGSDLAQPVRTALETTMRTTFARRPARCRVVVMTG
jgi:hypothetical protein